LVAIIVLIVVAACSAPIFGVFLWNARYNLRRAYAAVTIRVLLRHRESRGQPAA
jgi:hypothetical protein